jgi:hypothetical protein
MRDEETLSCARVRQDAFEGLRRLCGLADGFPPTWELWCEAVARRPCAGPGGKVDVDERRLAAWCRSAGVQPSFEALKLYVLVQRLRRTGVPLAA